MKAKTQSAADLRKLLAEVKRERDVLKSNLESLRADFKKLQQAYANLNHQDRIECATLELRAQTMRKVGAERVKFLDGTEVVLGEEPTRFARAPEPPRLEQEGVPDLPIPGGEPTQEELLFASSPLGPPPKDARPPPCVACGGEQGLDQTGHVMCYSCGDWALMPESARERYPERAPTT